MHRMSRKRVPDTQGPPRAGYEAKAAENAKTRNKQHTDKQTTHRVCRKRVPDTQGPPRAGYEAKAAKNAKQETNNT